MFRTKSIKYYVRCGILLKIKRCQDFTIIFAMIIYHYINYISNYFYEF